MDVTLAERKSSEGAAFRFRHEQLSRLMKERSISDAALAAEIGVVRGTVHRIRTGRQVPTAPHLAAICHVLRIPQDWLMEMEREVRQ